MQPASETKHIKEITLSTAGKTLRLQQRDDHGLTNGTTLWLGGQVLSYYLLSVLEPTHSTGDNKPRRKRAIELGSGIGMTALTLYSIGWNVCATDVEPVLSTVLLPNVRANTSQVINQEDNGTLVDDGEPVVECKELDWTIGPENWEWDSSAIASRGQQVEGDKEDGGARPPFDLIVTADTLYIPSLVTPLFTTLHHLARLSTHAHKRYSCPVYVAVERRDPDLMNRAFKEASSVWGFEVEMVRVGKMRRALERFGVVSNWAKERDVWEGVEIWKMKLPSSGLTAP